MWNSATLPLGFRFEPTDEELICYYLARKVSGQTLPSNAVVECDQVYHVEPRLLHGANDIAKNGDRKKKMKAEALYFFVQMKKKTRNGYRPDRITGDGYWKASSGDQKIMVGKKEVGVKKMLSYFTYKDQNKKSSKDGRKTDWVMHEYALSDPHEQAKKQFQPWTLCRISETGRSSSEAPNDSGDGCSHKRPYCSTVEAPAHSNHVSQASSSGQIITQQVEEINEQQNQAKKHRASVTMEQNEAAGAFISQELPSDNQSEIESATESCELPDPSSSEQWFDLEELLGMLDPPQEHADGLPNEAAGAFISQELPSDNQSEIESATESCELPDPSSSEQWFDIEELLGMLDPTQEHADGLPNEAAGAFISQELQSEIKSATETRELPDPSSSEQWFHVEEHADGLPNEAAGPLIPQELPSHHSGIESTSCEMEALTDSSSSTVGSLEEEWLNLQEFLSMNFGQSGIESTYEVLGMLDPPQEHADGFPNDAAELLIPQELPSQKSGIESAFKSFEMEALPDSSISPPLLPHEEWLYMR